MKLTIISAAPVRLPVKKSINLAAVEVKKFNIPAAFGGSLVIILLAGLFSKFLVLDRLLELQRYQAEAAQLQVQVDEGYKRLEDLMGVENEYAHYTLEAMTEEELTRCDREAVMELMREKVLKDHGAINWSVRGNYLSMEITGTSLQEINLLSQEIEESPLVDFCTVTKAKKGDNPQRVNPDGSITTIEEELVAATINAYLK